jgi:hypothetical protein
MLPLPLVPVLAPRLQSLTTTRWTRTTCRSRTVLLPVLVPLPVLARLLGVRVRVLVGLPT